MKRIALSAVVWLSLSAPAWAACAQSSVQAKDNLGNTANFATANIGASNCAGMVAVTGNAGATIDAAPGSAPTNAIAVQGVASMTALKVDPSGVTSPVSGTVTANVGTTNGLALDATVGKLNISQGTALGSNTGPMSQGSVTTSAPSYTTGQISPISLDTSGNLRVTGGVAQASTTSGQTGSLVMGAVTTAAPSYTTAQTDPISLDLFGNTRTTLGGDPCSSQPKTIKPINNAASSSNLLLVTGTASKKVYVCAVNLVAAAATNVALVEGTTTTNACDTGTAGMAGGATAATGWNFAANSGVALGSGVGTLSVTATAADNVCLFFSAANQVSGVLSYVVQ